jgi:transposase-like protein
LELFSSGLSTRSVERIVGSLFGEKMSAAKVSEIAQQIQPVREAWQQRPLGNGCFAIQIDAIRLHVRRQEVYNEACFIVMGIRPDGKREILGLYLFPEEGAHAWREVFADLIARGLNRIGLVISDGLQGIIEAVEEYYPGARHQLCLTHRKRNLITHIRSDKQKEFSDDFSHVFAVDDPANTLERIEARLLTFREKWKPHIANIDSCLETGKLKNYAAYLQFPAPVRRMLYTTNWIERLNAHIRKITKRVPAFPTTDSLLNLVFMATQHFEDGPYKRHIPDFYKHLKPLYENTVN